MVDVLRRGELPEEKIKIVTCTDCKSELRFKISEAKIVSDPRDGNFYVIDCPICSSQVAKAIK